MDTVQEWLEPIRRKSPDSSYEHSAIEGVYKITSGYTEKIKELEERDIASLAIAKGQFDIVEMQREKLKIAIKALETIRARLRLSYYDSDPRVQEISDVLENINAR